MWCAYASIKYVLDGQLIGIGPPKCGLNFIKKLKIFSYD